MSKNMPKVFRDTEFQQIGIALTDAQLTYVRDLVANDARDEISMTLGEWDNLNDKLDKAFETIHGPRT